jgi:hypothetical protein
MTTRAADVLADPVSVIIDLVAGAELALDRTAITAVVTQVAGGRGRRRRLAQCLAGRPSMLTDGRSPASEAAGELLIALRRAGAVSISLPVCAACGKQLRSMRRRGQDWYRTACGRRPARCASCGQDRAAATVDRQGRPRCRQCPDDDARDPVAILTGVITGLDPSLPAGRIAAAAWRAQPGPAKLRRLAWAVEDAPGLLTGDGAHAPMPAVLRLIDELCDAGAQAITRPACPRCHRVIRLTQRIGGQWLCRNCVARSRAQPCSQCGAMREAATRDEHGRPLCSNCLVNDPANQETCVTCGQRRRVSARTAAGPLCDTCRPWSAPASLEALMSANWCPVYQTPVLYSRFPRTFSAAYRRCKNGYAPRYTSAPSLPWRPSHHQPLANRHEDR